MPITYLGSIGNESNTTVLIEKPYKSNYHYLFMPLLLGETFSSVVIKFCCISYEYCYAAGSTFAKLKVIVTCTYSNFFAQGMQTRSSNILWKTADHHGTIECMIEFA